MSCKLFSVLAVYRLGSRRIDTQGVSIGNLCGWTAGLMLLKESVGGCCGRAQQAAVCQGCVFIWWIGMRSDDITHVILDTNVSLLSATRQQGREAVFF